MSCEQLARRINGLRPEINIKEERLDELKNQPMTPELFEEIQSLEDEVISMKQDIIRLNNQYKQNCKK